MDCKNLNNETSKTNFDPTKSPENMPLHRNSLPNNIKYIKNVSGDNLVRRRSIIGRRSSSLFGMGRQNKDLNNVNEIIQFAKESYIKIKNKRNMGNQEIPLDLSYSESLLEKNEINNLINIPSELKEILNILCNTNSQRTQKDNEILFNFLAKNKIHDNLKSDLIITDYNINQLYTHMKKYISGKIFKMHEPIYYSGEEGNNIYYVLNGIVGMYELITTEETLTCEEYFLKLCDEYDINEKCKKEGIYDVEEYVDLYLLYFISEENKFSFPLYCFEDFLNLKKIILKVKIYNILVESKDGNIMEYFNKFNIPLTYLNYDKLINDEISVSTYVENLKIKFNAKDYFYLKLLGPAKHKVKLMKYKKLQTLKPFEFFGNFEMNDLFPIRKFTTRSESNNTILMSINKFIYSNNINNIQKNLRNKEIDTFHDDYIFNNVQKNYFIQKIYSQFCIECLFKGDILFEQSDYIKKFIFVKEGVVELYLNNLSLKEFSQTIELIKNIISSKAKDFGIDFNKFIDFDDEIETKSDLNEKTLQGILKQKQNYIFSRSEKGFFGDYQLFFNLPSLINGKIVSDKSKIYFYDYENFKNLNEETYALNQSLKEFAFNKMKNILKRMIAVYNSYFRLSINKYKLNEKINLNYLNENPVKLFKNKKQDDNYKKEIDIPNNMPNKVKLKQNIILTEINNFEFLTKVDNSTRTISPTERNKKVKLKKINNINKKNKISWLIRENSEANHKIYPSMLYKNYSNLNRFNIILAKKSKKNNANDLKSGKIIIKTDDIIKNNKKEKLSRNKSKSAIHNSEQLNQKNEQLNTVILPPIINRNSTQNHKGTNSMTDEINNMKNEIIPIRERLYSKKSNSNLNELIHNCNIINEFYEKKAEDCCLYMQGLEKIKQIRLNGIKAAQIKAFKNSRLKNKNLWKIGYKQINLENDNDDED